MGPSKDDLYGNRPVAKREDEECIAAMIVNWRLYKNVQLKFMPLL